LWTGGYFDRTTFDTYTRALSAAAPAVVRDLGFGSAVTNNLGPRNAILLHKVYRSLAYHAPVAVVLPVAIYQ
jgi:hypothetical protein